MAIENFGGFALYVYLVFNFQIFSDLKDIDMKPFQLTLLLNLKYFEK